VTDENSIELKELLKNQLNPRACRKVSFEEPLSEYEEFVFRKYFNAMDENRDGNISFYELKNYFQRIGMETTNQEVRAMMRQADIDQGGTISFDEFVRILKKNENFNFSDGWRLAKELIKSEIEQVEKGHKYSESGKHFDYDLESPVKRTISDGSQVVLEDLSLRNKSSTFQESALSALEAIRDAHREGSITEEAKTYFKQTLLLGEPFDERYLTMIGAARATLLREVYLMQRSHTTPAGPATNMQITTNQKRIDHSLFGKTAVIQVFDDVEVCRIDQITRAPRHTMTTLYSYSDHTLSMLYSYFVLTLPML